MTARCPASHPYPFMDGLQCCKFNQEKVNPLLGPLCDGSVIGITSKCCKGDAFLKCPGVNCAANIGEEGSFCYYSLGLIKGNPNFCIVFMHYCSPKGAFLPVPREYIQFFPIYSLFGFNPSDSSI